MHAPSPASLMTHCVGFYAGRTITNFIIAPLFYYFSKYDVAKTWIRGVCLISDPSTLDAGAKSRLKPGMKKFTPHCVCFYYFLYVARKTRGWWRVAMAAVATLKRYLGHPWPLNKLQQFRARSRDDPRPRRGRRIANHPH